MKRSVNNVASAVILGLSVLLVTGAVTLKTAGAQSCEPDQLATKYPSLAGRTLLIAADPAIQPYNFRDPDDFENLIGFDSDLARATFDCVGAQYEFFLGGWSGLLPAIIAGQADVMWSDLYYTPERAKQVDYVIYMQAGTGALVPLGNPKNVGSIEDLCGLRATAGLGTVEEAAMRDQTKKCLDAGMEEIDILTFPDVASGSRLVRNDRADVMLTDLGLVDSLVGNNQDVYVRAFMILSTFKIGVAVKNGNDDLLNAIYDGLTILQADGTQQALFEKYSIDPTLQRATEILRD